MAYYVGNGRGYENAVADRFLDGTAAIAEVWRTGDREAAADHVTDEMAERTIEELSLSMY